ncbi:ABC transporter permease [Cellulomonas wangsupingiae]|uniref:ABC transporter permease n=1 Tax=Cellulomonas wangsupingiae TaxID=2968085 RepID=A0ABY5K8T8_9CELL|nr:ABC transporter permease [Cellulomonas wangsupingiae]MCC2334118.1 ABC transporter permease [Cellulomonas wangsupingiae]MCM0638732.1 ABC transporter permease [Cellulomonas wangsupingiae]UUI65361.1 ABC transporter permease [Cellulomonas wangsupingiae]
MSTAPRTPTSPGGTPAASRTGGTAPRDTGGRTGLVARTAVVQLRASFRNAEFAVGAVAVPVLLYAMFGLPNASSQLPGGTRIGLAMLVSLTAYGVVSLALFTFGENVAKDRGRGWLRTLRATPFPTAAYLGGTSLTAAVHALLIVAGTGLLAALAGGVRLDVGRWAAFAGIMTAGVLVFSTLGFAIAYLARPRAATVMANLLFLPLAFASGFFFPLSELPAVIGDVAPYLPTFHFGQLAYRAVMPASDVAAFTGAATQPVALHVAWVVGSAVLLGAVALLAARREAVTRRG